MMTNKVLQNMIPDSDKERLHRESNPFTAFYSQKIQFKTFKK